MMSVSLITKNVLLGIGGGIAAYKSADLVRRLKERGFDVRVVMSQSAIEFITPLTLQALSGHPVSSSLLDPAAEAAMGHIELARWADLVIIAPATANLLARINAGMADELITTTCLATEAPIALCPAMNQQMYRNLATQANLASLQSRGYTLWGPASGSQACGEVGPGRMLEPLEIAELASRFFATKDVYAEQESQPLAGQSVLITAGPTREAIDPVRYISNHSSGKMGFALAKAAADMGADVTLVAGPVNLATPEGVTRINVESAQNMLDAVMENVDNKDIFIGCAAVADYRVSDIATSKIKKSAEEMQLALVRNPDILATVASLANRPFMVGFAAETHDVETYARDKLKRKNLNMIAANDVSVAGLGFNADANALRVFWPQGSQDLPATDKLTLARQLLSLIVKEKQHK
ncbi:bifunctional phosphopantothenoylcysteine decarboxylase/phosphopantothenate--cysteine ligase CoaBC [Shewanella xiamenensis]|uniref:bifunctional phosphopantothenoylcysteine decarboxylase/phosphopantothenate--cysteine ligase CoaBC n=1 Tax=Shewanella xiamenensis TaxID=332186 RepID=UPI0024A6A3FC|nr:bifunctional phosphopantothenoylcysteine decarboxylase/phosphopantothenate--cysteine ligase CoaBC [Shewanella xiamenensis]MDI5837607.1 bifunctional phosphopantothenoylcysteine decarboxylase/phosphopantothenate--cysteine ligase CoaBC [Shewanella xiamenensis]MDI5841167.1 bifunctional phosphopantothenoylcysteine decarboxylase/phosphopantothenate--cysteine ligase CoaBC [Shewanella xiamenensis]MDI5845524.1 bifunctional phosphopantothenoylcysteine decarboxylase/phosphopantothenate--cysteine ligase 